MHFFPTFATNIAYGTAPPGLLLEVKDPEVLVTDALCEQIDTPKENGVHLVCDKNTDALCCERRQKPSLEIQARVLEMETKAQ